MSVRQSSVAAAVPNSSLFSRDLKLMNGKSLLNPGLQNAVSGNNLLMKQTNDFGKRSTSSPYSFKAKANYQPLNVAGIGSSKVNVGSYNALQTTKSVEDAERRFQEMYQAEKYRLRKKEIANKEMINQISKKLKIQEKKSTEESRVAIELRRRYDQMKRKVEGLEEEKKETHKQLKGLFTLFTTQRKALEVSIQKNKRLEEECLALGSKNRENEEGKKLMQRQVEHLENESQTLTVRMRKERESSEQELDEKKQTINRQNNEIQETCSQKMSLKNQIDEYEQKIKSLILELESESKKHINEVKGLHEHYIGFKSQAAELQNCLQLYKGDQEKAILGERESKKEVIRLTFANDELQERVNYMDRKYTSLVNRCSASQEDLDAVEVIMASGQDPQSPGAGKGTSIEKKRQQQYPIRSQSRHEKRRDEPQMKEEIATDIVGSYDYYGEEGVEASPDKRDFRQRQDMKHQQPLNARQSNKSSIVETSSQGKKTNIVEVLDLGDDEQASNGNQYFSDGGDDAQEDGDGVNPTLLQASESGDLLKKLIDNIQNNHALKNESVRAQFKLHLIEGEEDLHRYKNLLNAMAALFFTNHRMNDVTLLFQVWRDAALAKQKRQLLEEKMELDAQSADKTSKHRATPIIQIDTELANQEIFQNYHNENQLEEVLAQSDHLRDEEEQNTNELQVESSPEAEAADPLEDSDTQKERRAKKFIDGLRKIGPFSKQILNYSYPPLLYQRGEEEEEEESQDQGECDEDEDDDQQMLGHSPGGLGDEDENGLGQLPDFRDSDDELRALGQDLAGNSDQDDDDDNLDIDDDDDLLNKLKRAANEDDQHDSNRFYEEMLEKHGHIDPNEFEADEFAEGIGIGGHATNLDGLDKDQIMKMIDQEVDGYSDEEDDAILQDIEDGGDLQMLHHEPGAAMGGRFQQSAGGSSKRRHHMGEQHDSTIINSSQNTSLEQNFI